MSEQLVENEITLEVDGSHALISEHAIIDPSAKIGSHVKIGPWTQIGPNVEIGDFTEIGSHVVIERNTKLGMHNKLHSYAALGGEPQFLAFNGEDTFLEIGDNNIFREFVTINRGAMHGTGVTRIGNYNCFLAYSHVAHDALVTDHVLFVNHASIAGHVRIDHHATIGAYSAVHQHVRIGAYSFISRSALVGKDILPFMTVVGTPGAPCGLNSVGLRRNGFTNESIAAIKRAYHLIYRQGGKLRDIREELLKMSTETPEINMMLEIIDQSTRGIAR